MKDYRLVILGAGGVGKTCLVQRFLYGSFLDNYIPTVDDIHRPILQLPGGDIHGVEILDTAGLHQFPAMRKLSIQSGRAFIVVFSLSDAASLTSALVITDSIRSMKGDQTPVMLVGNKQDLAGERAVDGVEAARLAADRFCAYIETSALCERNIEKVFYELLSEIFNGSTPGSATDKTRKQKQRSESSRGQKLSGRLMRMYKTMNRQRSMSSSSKDSTDECNNYTDSGDINSKALCTVM